jgi:hypothetical protein
MLKCMLMTSLVKNWQLKGIRKHNIMWFPILKSTRRETGEKTLDLLNSESPTPNYGLFPRTTHLYKSNRQVLEKILSKAKDDTSFLSFDIVHSSSDLGLVYKVKAEHKSGATLFYDGLCLRITRTISADEFNLDTLLSKTGAPRDEMEVFNDFARCVKYFFPEKEFFERSYSYYTIDETNWESLGLRRQGEAHLRLLIKDPRIFRITALIFHEQGKDFDVYLGEEEQTHQMIAHDFFMIQEISMFNELFDTKLTDIARYRSKLGIDFGGVISPIWRIDEKHRMWNSAKETMKSVYGIRDIVDKGRLLVSAIRYIVEKKWAFFNGPRQIWIAGEEQDTEEKVQHPMTHFFEVRLEGSEIKDIPNSPIDPFYRSVFEELATKVNVISNQADEIYQRERDLLTAFQTEFSLYAVWFALGALVIAMISIILLRF